MSQTHAPALDQAQATVSQPARAPRPVTKEGKQGKLATLCNAVLPADRGLIGAAVPIDVPVRGRVGTLRIRVLAAAG